MRPDVEGFRVKYGLSCVIGRSGRQGPAATLRQHCPQMTQSPGSLMGVLERLFSKDRSSGT